MSTRFKKTRSGRFAVKLHANERALLRSLSDQYRDLLLHGDGADPAMQRLFPPASKEDAALAAEVDGLVRSDLTTQRLDALDVMERTIDAAQLQHDEMEAWLAVCNDLRLILGARLRVGEDSTEDDFTGEDRDSFDIYRFLTFLASQLIAALSGITELKLAPDIMRAGREEDGG